MNIFNMSTTTQNAYIYNKHH